ncbi:MAG TPA: MFS transporter, partial [Thermomicrobiales bacterium]|nr:MFS transporter [Thermomicrobiales bacterium]
FALAATLISLVVAPAMTRSHGPALGESVWRSMAVGGSHVRKSPVLRTVFLLQALIALSDGPLTASLAPFIRQTLGRSASDFGLFLSMRGVAGVVGSVLFAQFARRFREDQVLIVSLFILGAEVVALAVLRNFWIIIGMMILVGPVFAALNTVIPTLLQRASADAWRGRMFALFGAMAGGIFALSTLLGAAAGSLTSPPLVMAVSGCLYLGAAVVALVLLPRAYQSMRQHRATADRTVYSD